MNLALRLIIVYFVFRFAEAFCAIHPAIAFLIKASAVIGLIFFIGFFLETFFPH